MVQMKASATSKILAGCSFIMQTLSTLIDTVSWTWPLSMTQPQAAVPADCSVHTLTFSAPTTHTACPRLSSVTGCGTVLARRMRTAVKGTSVLATTVVARLVSVCTLTTCVTTWLTALSGTASFSVASCVPQAAGVMVWLSFAIWASLLKTIRSWGTWVLWAVGWPRHYWQTPSCWSTSVWRTADLSHSSCHPCLTCTPWISGSTQ